MHFYSFKRNKKFSQKRIDCFNPAKKHNQTAREGQKSLIKQLRNYKTKKEKKKVVQYREQDKDGVIPDKNRDCVKISTGR